MNKEQAEELRARFEALPDNHVIKIDEVDLVPAVLGASISWTHANTDGRLLYITAYDQNVRTIGDLKRLSIAHPRAEGDDESKSFAEAVGEGVATGMQPVLQQLREQIVWNRVRLRAILELLEEDRPGFYVRLGERVRTIADRDWAALMDELFILEPDVLEERHAAWRAEEKSRFDALLGPEAAKREEDAWKEWSAKHQAVALGATEGEGGPQSPK